MNGPGQGILLRIFVDEEDKWHGKALHRALVEAALTHGLAGATVLRGHEGFGAHSRIHEIHLADFSPNLPMVVEIVDSEEAIQAFLPAVQEMMQEGLVTWERVNVIVYRHRDSQE